MSVTQRSWVSFNKAKSLLAQMIVEGSHCEAVLDLSAELSQEIETMDQVGQAKVLWAYVRGEILYLEDPYSDDHFQSADITLKRKAGDCDDQVILLGSLLRSIGLKVRLVFVFETAPTGSSVEFPAHVYLEVDLGAQFKRELWACVDTVPVPGNSGGFYFATFAKDQPMGYRERVLVN